jgi:hypothetical protein
MKSDLVISFIKKFRNALNKNEETIKSKIQSMKDSQGNSDFSGSSYNGPGKADSDKVIFNKNQRGR